MKKVIFVITACLGLAASADYMYWMVEPDVGGTDVSGASTTFNWDTAYLTYEGYTGGGKGIASLSVDDAELYNAIGSYAMADIGSDYSGRSYFIELYSGDTWLAASSPVSASALSQYIFGDNSMSAMPATAFGMAQATYAVPEPTSGLLFLVGGMLLGLKRRRMA